MVSYRSIACAPSPCGPSFPVSRLGGRYPADYYGHSVTLGLAPGEVIPRSHCRTYRARLRHPVRLPLMPLLGIAPAPRRITAGTPVHPAAGAGTGFRRLSGRRLLSPSGDWDSSNQAFTLSRGSPGTPFLRLDTATGLLACCIHRAFLFRSRVSHWTHGHLLQSVPAARAILTMRLVAHTGRTAGTSGPPPRSPRAGTGSRQRPRLRELESSDQSPATRDRPTQQRPHRDRNALACSSPPRTPVTHGAS